MKDVFINGLGAFLPGAPVANRDMENYIGMIDGKPSRHRALALRQNGIKTRHYALGPDGRAHYSSAQMAAAAVRAAVKNSEASMESISYLASSATLGDVLVPGLASHVHAELKLRPLEIANYQSVCASVLMAIKGAYLQVRAGEHECAAVTGSEFASRYFRPGFYEGTDKVDANGVLRYDSDFLRFTLSDGAGAAILESRPNARGLSLKIKWIDIKSYADRFDTCMYAGGVANQNDMTFWSSYATPSAAAGCGALALTQDFDLLKRMIPVWVSHYLDMIDQGKIVVDKIDHVCSHYSSHALREDVMALLRKAGAMIPEEKWFTNLYSKGNTGTASILIMLEELFYGGRLKPGESVLCHVPESGRGLNGFMMLEVI